MHWVQSQVLLLDEVFIEVLTYLRGWVNIISIAFSKEFLAYVNALIAWD